tara:strand:+ start:1851 stop:3116 length:1266 start_codon:yes stop_codon:yes gene_type:complete
MSRLKKIMRSALSWIKRTTLIKGAASLLLTFATLVLLEGALFFLEPNLTPKTLTQDETTNSDVLLRTIPPHWEDHDENGFPNSTFGNASVLTTGDSHTYGNSAPKGKDWPNQFSEIANLSVYNMSTGGNGFAAYYYWVDRYVEDVNPEIIIVSFYNGNDFFDTAETVYTKPYWIDFRKDKANLSFVKTVELPQKSSNSSRSGVREFVISTRVGSHVIAPLYDTVKKFFTEEVEPDDQLELSGPRLPYPQLSDSKFSSDSRFSEWAGDEPMTCQFRYRNMVTDISTNEVVEGFRLSKLFVKRITDIGKRLDIPVVFVSIPTKCSLMNRLLEKESANYKKHYSPFLSNELSLENKLGDFALQHDAFFLSLRAGMNAKFNEGSFLFEDVYHSSPDGHPGSKGYQLYATLIYEFLLRHKLILPAK